MKRFARILLACLLFGGAIHLTARAEQPSAGLPGVGEPDRTQLLLLPGLNPIPITRFPALRDGNLLAERLTLSQVFGTPQQSGLTPGSAETADIVRIFFKGQWNHFFYFVGVDGPGGELPSGWKQLGQGLEDAGNFTWDYTAGVAIDSRRTSPSRITLGPGFARTTDSLLVLPQGTHFFNRVYDGPLTLADLKLESFFIRYTGPVPPVVRPIPGAPGGVEGDLKADEYIDPLTNTHYVLTEEGTWFDRPSGEKVDPQTLVVPGTFGLHRVGPGTEFVLSAPTLPPLQLRKPPNLALEEDAVRRVLGEGFGPPECTCAMLLHGDQNRPISLHVIESANGHAVIRVGKHPPNVTTHSLAAVTGQGFIGSLERVPPLLSLEQPVRSFFSEQPVPTPIAYKAELKAPEPREGERRFFSEFTPDGLLFFTISGDDWKANTLLEIDFMAITPRERKIALHFPQIRLLDDTDVAGLAQALAELLRLGLVERGLVPAPNLQIDVSGRLDLATLTLNLGAPLTSGKLDLCTLSPPPLPVIQTTSQAVAEGGVIQISGRDFGNRPEDLCLVLAPANGAGRTVPMRPVALNRDGTSMLARVVGRFPVGQPYRVMMAKGMGRTRPIDLGFNNIIQRQGVWTWRGLGLGTASSPGTIMPALGQGEVAQFFGQLVDGTLEVTLDQAWPNNAEVSISFTASTETVQLDSYAPNLCFTVNGSTEECAKRIQRVLKAAFVQGGMASANQVQVQRRVEGDKVTLSVDIFTLDGVRDPITNGHLDISVGQESSPCIPPPPDDSDGDLIQDSWETAFFGMPPEEVDPLGDPDTDGLFNNVEFALNTDPFFPNQTDPLTITLDGENHPIVQFERHTAAANFYHFDVETSMDGTHWERLPNLELLTVQPIGTFGETIVARSVVSALELGASYYRLRVTPRS